MKNQIASIAVIAVVFVLAVAATLGAISLRNCSYDDGGGNYASNSSWETISLDGSVPLDSQDLEKADSHEIRNCTDSFLVEVCSKWEVSNLSITDSPALTSLEGIGSCPNLNSLTVSHTPNLNWDTLPDQVPLNTLELGSSCGLADGDIPVLHRLKALTTLEIWPGVGDADLTASGVLSLSEMNLEGLRLAVRFDPDEDLRGWSAFNHLQWLDLSSSEGMTKAQRETLATVLPDVVLFLGN